MGVFAGTNVDLNKNRSNLILQLDAANYDSYSGIGTSWNDLASNTNFTLTNCTFNQTEIVGNGTNAYIESNSNIDLSTYSNFSIVFGVKSSNYSTESVLLEYGLSNYFYYFPTSIATLGHTALQETATGISSFSPVYNTTSITTLGHTPLQETATGISSFNALKNNGFLLKIENNSIISNTVIDNKIYPISSNTINTTTHNLISVVYSDLNTSSSSVSMYQGNSLVGTVGLTTSISFSNSIAYLLSIGSVNKLSNSAIKYFSIYNKNISSSEVTSIRAAYGSRT